MFSLRICPDNDHESYVPQNHVASRRAALPINVGINSGLLFLGKPQAPLGNGYVVIAFLGPNSGNIESHQTRCHFSRPNDLFRDIPVFIRIIASLFLRRSLSDFDSHQGKIRLIPSISKLSGVFPC
jgi:hypothetical protein